MNQQVRKPISSAGSFLDLIVYQKSEGHLLILTSIGVPNTKKKKRGSTCKGLSVKASVCCLTQFTPFITWVNTGNKLNEKGRIVSIRISIHTIDFWNNTNDQASQNQKVIYLPYVQHTSEHIQRICKQVGVKAVFKSRGTLREALMKVKIPRPQLLKKGVVYEVPCMDCSSTYIGETGRTLKKRLVEHKEQ